MWKAVGNVSPILVMLTSHSDSDFECSNVSLKEKKPDGVYPTATFERMKEKFHGFQQTDHVKHNFNSILHWLFSHSQHGGRLWYHLLLFFYLTFNQLGTSTGMTNSYLHTKSS